MSYRHLHLAAVLTALASWLVAADARAWVETRIRSHAVVVDAARDGTATVSHEIVIKVRGGPFKSFEVEGVDDDAELSPDARVTRLRADAKNEWPLLLHKGDDGSLSVEVDDKKGLRAGVYQFRFSYRTNLLARDLLEQRGAVVELAWVGPRLSDGIDAAKATFRLPKADTPPRLPEARDDGARQDASDLLVSEVRRGPEKDEVELVRTHVAKGEPAIWNLEASAQCFNAFTPPPANSGSEIGDSSFDNSRLRLYWLFAALGIALLYVLVLGLKWSVLRKAADAKKMEVRALVPLPMPVRVALAGALLAGAFLTAVSVAYPTLAGVLLVLSMLFAADLPPRTLPGMRGPGHWVRQADTLLPPRVNPVPGRFFDAGTTAGFLLFAGCLALFAGGALWLVSRAPYHALVTALGSACLLPVFCTGRGTQLPPDPVARPRRFFASLARRLRRETESEVSLLARLPDAGQTPDELRLLIEPKCAPRGLLALECGLEYQVGTGAVVDLPCLMLRALDDSPAYYAMPRNVVWTRGRTPNERVALLRPALPTRAACAELVKQVLDTLAQAGGKAPVAQRVSCNKPSSSRGRSLSTSKSATPAFSARM